MRFYLLLLPLILLSLAGCKFKFNSNFAIGVGEQDAGSSTNITLVLTEVSAIASSTNSTPSYTFNSSDAGQIIYAGSCSSVTSQAVQGDNTIVLGALHAGYYDDCTLQIKNSAEAWSNVLTISPFVVEPPFSFSYILPLFTNSGEFLTTAGNQLSVFGLDFTGLQVELNGSVMAATSQGPYWLSFLTPPLPAGDYPMVLRNTMGSMEMPVTIKSPFIVQTLQAGSEHLCAINPAQELWCWGANDNGQLGDGTTTKRMAPVKVLNAVTQVSLGAAHNCAIDVNQDLYCWGDNSQQQIQNNPTPAYQTPTVVLSDVAFVSAGFKHTCALKSDNSVWCWGDSFASSASQITGIQAKSLSSGKGFSCAHLLDDSVACWGNNSQGQLGDDGTNISSQTPVAVVGLTQIQALSAGVDHSCAITQGNELWCWGNNTYGQLGNGSNTSSNQPIQLSGFTAKSISLGEQFSCAIDTSNNSWCWGINQHGQLGNNHIDTQFSPVNVSDIDTTLALATGKGFSCAVLNNHTASCWGRSVNELGSFNVSTNMNGVVAKTQLSQVEKIGAGNHHYCAVLQDKTVQCWGVNNYGQLGSGGSSADAIPTVFAKQVTGITDALDVSAGAHHSCALNNDGSVACFGRNNLGQLGDGTNNSSANPVTVTINQATLIGAGDGHSCAVLNNGEVWCWGDNGKGQLGNNSTTASNTPEQVHNITNANAVAIGQQHSCALLDDQSVWCWGDN